MADQSVSHKVLLLGAFPPPVGGAAKNNQLMYEALVELGVSVKKLDVSASALSHHRTLGFHFERIRQNISVNLAIRRASKNAVVYAVPDAGLGAWYTLAHIRAARARWSGAVIHHRSCFYIEHENKPIRLMHNAAGGEALHIFLSPGMAEKYQARYGSCRFMVASNGRFVAAEAELAPVARVDGPLRVGHLSNLCRDKGFFQVADAFEAIREDRPDAELYLAGPIIEEGVGERLEMLRARYGQSVHHLGSVGGNAKTAFYRGIDLFMFPTNFDQEAAPNVLYEALAAGVPCLSNDRGVIPEIVSVKAGAVFPRNANFASLAREYVASLDVSGAASLDRATQIKRLACEDSAAGQRQYDKLLSLLAAGGMELSEDAWH